MFLDASIASSVIIRNCGQRNQTNKFCSIIRVVSVYDSSRHHRNQFLLTSEMTQVTQKKQYKKKQYLMATKKLYTRGKKIIGIIFFKKVLKLNCWCIDPNRFANKVYQHESSFHQNAYWKEERPHFRSKITKHTASVSSGVFSRFSLVETGTERLYLAKACSGTNKQLRFSY